MLHLLTLRALLLLLLLLSSYIWPRIFLFVSSKRRRRVYAYKTQKQVAPRKTAKFTTADSISLSLSFSSLSGLSGLSETHFSLLLLLPCLVTEKKKRNKGEKKRAGHAQTDVRASLSQSVDVLLVGEKDLQVVFRPTWNCVAESAAVDKISERERERRPFFFAVGTFSFHPVWPSFSPRWIERERSNVPSVVKSTVYYSDNLQMTQHSLSSSTLAVINTTPK